MKAIDILLDLLYPEKCVFCGRALKGGEECFCRKCGETLPMREGAAERASVKNSEFCVVPLYYQDVVRESLLRYKFGGASYRSAIYAELLMPYIEKHIQEKPDVVTWAPLSAKRLRKRGYDQARLLAEEIAKRLGIPCEKLLDKISDTPPQSGIKDAEERRANVLGAYAASAGAKIEGRSALLVDDILTTGSTMGECCRILRESGARRVLCTAVAGGRKVAKTGENVYCKS